MNDTANSDGKHATIETLQIPSMFLPLLGVPGKPGPLKFIEKSPNSVTIGWTAPTDDGGRPITGYLIQYSMFRMTGESKGML